MDIILKSLKLHNFKGIKDFEVEFGHVTDIKGKNGLGKSTIFDAFNWLLFDKDSQGRKNFEIKTLDETGEPLHKLEHTVEGNLIIDGIQLTLAKTFKEKWTKKRGQATQNFSGHETKHYINGVEVIKKEYEEKIKEIMDEGLFKLVTNPMYFPNLNWKEQRTIVQEIIGTIDDERVINYNSKLAPLKGAYTDSINEYNARTKASIKKINDEIKLIPARIDECNNNIVDIDFTELEARKKEVEKKINDIDERIEDSSKGNDVLLEHKQNLFNLKQEYQEKLNHARVVASNGKDKLINKLQVKKDELREVNSVMKNYSYEIEKEEARKRSYETSLIGINEKLNKLRNKWKEVKSRDFEVENKFCKYCGQELPTHDIEQLEEIFNLNKSKELETICTNADKAKKEKEELEEKIEKIKEINKETKEQSEEANKNKKALEEEIKEIQTEIDNFIVPTDINFDGKVQLEREIELVEEDIKNFKTLDNTELKAEKQVLKAELAQINSKLAGKENNERLKERIKELDAEEVELAQKVAKLEGQLFLCEEFTRTQVELSEGMINKKFKNIKFKLFKELINGGLEETCEILCDGVPYGNANTASQINAGLEVIKTLSDHYGIHAPIFIDNAESVNKIIDLESQIIKLTVSLDNKLTVVKDGQAEEISISKEDREFFEKKLEEIKENITDYSNGYMIADIFPEATRIKEYIAGESRWSVTKVQIYEYKGLYLEACWQNPATEMQDGQETNLEVYEVKAYKKEVLDFE
ncbi:nucleoside triphosphate hydrolase [Clostridium phage vB_CpeS-1181]|uniref:AAA family ATPase n=1 Tax=Clostridium perfringens TaxID=1502 RepID=UPI0009935764|nr:ATP-binding protein [Clostridium perfringens]QTZ83030.1 nucleoside triphosphate hydrolase [Clostridium phage vB_CpeS-1181]